MGNSSCSCVVVLSRYSTLVSLAFIIVTILYSTLGALDYSDTVSGDNSEVKHLVHMNFLNMDKSLNGGDITDQVVDADEDKHMVYCDCGQETLFSVPS